LRTWERGSRTKIKVSTRTFSKVTDWKLLSEHCAVRVAEGDAVFAEAGGDGRALAFGQVFEVQVAHARGGVHDGAGDAGFLGGRIKLRDSVQRYVELLRSGPKGGGKGYEAAKTREKEAKARLAEMEADEKEGKLLELSVVQQTCGNICTAFTARLANFGDGLASICHNQPLQRRAAAMLKEISRMPHVPKPK